MKTPHFASKSRFLAILIALLCVGGLFALSYSNSQGSLWIFSYNPYGLVSLVTFVGCLGLLIFFASKPARTDERMWLSFYLAGLCVLSGGEMMQRFSPTPEGAIFWTTLSAIGIAIVPVSLYLFALAYTNQTDRRFPGVTAVLLTSGFIIAFFYAYTDLIFFGDPTAAKLYPWGYNNDPATGLIFSLVWLNLLCLLAVARFVSFRRRTHNPILRKQSLIFIFASSVPVIGGTITDGVLPLLGITNLPPSAVTMSAITAFLLLYGVLRYKIVNLNPTLFSNTILSIMHEAVVVTDTQFRILHLNPEAEKLLGQSDIARHQLSLLDAIPVSARAGFSRSFRDQSLTGSTIELDRINLVGPTARTPVRITGSYLHSPELEAYVLVLTDITTELKTRSIIERQVKERTQELHAARAYLVASINSLEQGFILVNDRNEVELMNGAAEQLIKSGGGDLSKRQLAAVIAPIKWNMSLDVEVSAVLTKRKPKQLQAVTANGKVYVVYISAVIDESKALGAAIVIEDITEQRVMERSRDEFFSIASHELRTPLTAIRGNMSIAKRYFPEVKQNQKLSQTINDTYEASVRLIDIVNDFLDSSRLEQGRMVFHLGSFKLQDIWKSVIAELQPLMTKNQNTISAELADVPPLYADSVRVRQILLNLVANANKYTHAGTITAQTEVKGRKLLLRISDTGQGIPAENQQYLFHKFQQAAGSILTRDNTQGTGLGLYIARMLAGYMHGDVSLEHSEEGKGSTFLVILPLAPKEKQD